MASSSIEFIPLINTSFLPTVYFCKGNETFEAWKAAAADKRSETEGVRTLPASRPALEIKNEVPEGIMSNVWEPTTADMNFVKSSLVNLESITAGAPAGTPLIANTMTVDPLVASPECRVPVLVPGLGKGEGFREGGRPVACDFFYVYNGPHVPPEHRIECPEGDEASVPPPAADDAEDESYEACGCPEGREHGYCLCDSASVINTTEHEIWWFKNKAIFDAWVASDPDPSKRAREGEGFRSWPACPTSTNVIYSSGPIVERGGWRMRSKGKPLRILNYNRIMKRRNRRLALIASYETAQHIFNLTQHIGPVLVPNNAPADRLMEGGKFWGAPYFFSFDHQYFQKKQSQQELAQKQQQE